MAKPARPTSPPFWFDETGPIRDLSVLRPEDLDAIFAAGAEPERNRYNDLPRFGRAYSGPALRTWLAERGWAADKEDTKP